MLYSVGSCETADGWLFIRSFVGIALAKAKRWPSSSHLWTAFGKILRHKIVNGSLQILFLACLNSSSSEFYVGFRLQHILATFNMCNYYLYNDLKQDNPPFPPSYFMCWVGWWDLFYWLVVMICWFDRTTIFPLSMIFLPSFLNFWRGLVAEASFMVSISWWELGADNIHFEIWKWSSHIIVWRKSKAVR